MKNKLSVLVVEDDLVDLHIATCILKRIDEEITVVHSPNGEEAVSYLYDIKTALPDLILLDINMPIMNGKEFLKQRALVEDFRNIPVIMLSSSGFSIEKNECLSLGADDFIEKPLTVETSRYYMQRYNLLKVEEK